FRDTYAYILNDHNSILRYPLIQIEFPKSIKTPAHHRAQIQRCRSGPPDSMRSQRDLMIKINIRVLVAFVARETRGQKRLCEFWNSRNVNRPFVEICSRAPFSRE